MKYNLFIKILSILVLTSCSSKVKDKTFLDTKTYKNSYNKNQNGIIIFNIEVHGIHKITLKHESGEIYSKIINDFHNPKFILQLKEGKWTFDKFEEIDKSKLESKKYWIYLEPIKPNIDKSFKAEFYVEKNKIKYLGDISFEEPKLCTKEFKCTKKDIYIKNKFKFNEKYFQNYYSKNKNTRIIKDLLRKDKVTFEEENLKNFNTFKQLCLSNQKIKNRYPITCKYFKKDNISINSNEFILSYNTDRANRILNGEN